MTDKDDIYAPYIQPRGPAYRDDQVDPRFSHYNDPIDTSPGRPAETRTSTGTRPLRSKLP